MSLLAEKYVNGKLSVSNRLVMPPMATAKGTADGMVTDAVLKYYKEKTDGGYIGLVITEHCFVSVEGKAGRGQLSVSDDSVIPGMSKLAQTIKQAGSVALMQISHSGAAAKKEITGAQTVINVNEIDTAEIKRIVSAFVQAAKRAQAAGFDGIELHAAHGYLLNQFYSPLVNRRADEYGGALQNRIRALLEVVTGIRASVGNSFIVAVRLGACDYQAGGSTIDDAIAASKALEAAGADIIDISGGMNGMTRQGYTGLSYFSDTSAAVREQVTVPVIVTGGVTDANTAEKILSLGQADLVGVGRAILKDSAWARKAITQQ